MARYELTGPDGSRYEITAPEGTSEQEVFKVFQQQLGQQRPAAPAPTEQPERTGTLSALAQGVGQGITFGLSDEAEGLGRAALGYLTGDKRPFGERYGEGTKISRDRLKNARDTNPVAYYGGEIAGGVAVPMGAARLGVAKAVTEAPGVGKALGLMGFGASQRAAGAGLATRIGAGAREGAAYGAVYGFNQGEGGALERAQSALGGAAGGLVIGGAIPPAVDAVRSAGQAMWTPVQATLMPKQAARQQLAQALMRDYTPNSTEGSPGRLSMSAFDRVDDKVQSMLAENPRAMVADAGGENTRGLLRSAANMPNPQAERLRKTVDARQSTQWARIEGDVQKNLGGQDMFAIQAGRKAERGTNAAQAYDPAYKAPVRPEAAAEIRDFIESRPYMRELYNDTVENLAGMRGSKAADELKARPWEMLHRVKMQMDATIGKLRKGQNPPSKQNWDANEITSLKNQFNDLLKKHNPQYRAANAKFADESAIINATDEGFEAFKTMPPEMLRQRIQQLAKSSPAEAEAFRVGSGRNIINDIRRANANNDRTDAIFSSPDMQMRLAAIMPDRRALRAFQRRLVIEAKMADTRKAVQGNSTTTKQLTHAAEAGQPIKAVQDVMNVASGNWGRAFDAVSRQLQRFSGMTPDVAAEIINQAMRKNAFGSEDAMVAAFRRAEREPAYRARLVQTLIAGAASSQAGP